MARTVNEKYTIQAACQRFTEGHVTLDLFGLSAPEVGQVHDDELRPF